MKNFRDVELLSSYLDGQLSPSDCARLEARISSDLELVSALNDLRATRNILRKLPARKAPRNFTLTRKMVGLKPPLPRSYSVFRFSTAFATLLLFLTFAANMIVPRISFGAGAPAPMMLSESSGMGGGAPAAEAPLATQAPALAAAPLAAVEPTATEIAPAANQDTVRVMGTALAEGQLPKTAETELVVQTQPQARSEAPISSSWQIGLLMIGSLCALGMFALRRSAMRKWK